MSVWVVGSGCEWLLFNRKWSNVAVEALTVLDMVAEVVVSEPRRQDGG